MLDNGCEALYDTFLGLPPDECAYASSRVVLLRVPYDRTTSYGGGAAAGPAAIVAASQQVELFDAELGLQPSLVGLHMPAAIGPRAAGPESMVDEVEQAANRYCRDGKRVFVLGGEHTVAVGGARAAAASGPVSFLQIDAHLDLRDQYEGSRFSHACTARRLLELGPVVAVGVRAACPEELDVIQQQGLRPVWGHELPGLTDEDLARRVLDQLGPRVYVTLDVDGLDPSVVPATGTPVPGGLGWYQTLALLRRVSAERTVVGCDLCELAPRPGDRVSDFAAALLAHKMIGYFFSSKPGPA